MNDERLVLRRVQEGRGDLDAHLVYADFLQNRGHPLGELIALSCALHDTKAPPGPLKGTYERLVASEAEALRVGWTELTLDWELGLVRRARIGFARQPETVAAFVTAPACQAIRRLTFTGFDQTMAEGIARCLDQVPESLTEVVVDGLPRNCDLDAIARTLPTLPNLRHLKYHLADGLPVLPNLVDLNAYPQDSLTVGAWPALTRLRLIYGVPGVQPHSWLSALSTAMPNLQHLRVQGPWFFSPEEWLESDVGRRLKSFDCGLAMTTNHVDGIEARASLYDHLDDFVLAGRRLRSTPSYRRQWDVPDDYFWR